MNKLECILKTLNEKKAENILVMDLRDVELIHDFMVIASVSNMRFLNALKDYVVDDLELNDFKIHHKEGTDESEWLLIDCYDIVVHLFINEARAHYSLDRLWADKRIEEKLS